jgi:2-dehydro-3-deoxyphosphogluconate aldolase/(4S)-4-hydroxy-2-oxoglutarate aldolase
VTTRIKISEQLRVTRVVAVVRGTTAEHLPATVQTLVDNGLRCIELTLNTPSALEVLADFTSRYSEVAWGAGTVLSAAGVRAAAEAGARFIVAPNLDAEVGTACAEAGLGWFPGAATPTEIQLAWSLGATAVKIFPARSLGGPDYLREVAGPLNDVLMVPTGGVGLDAIRDYLSAGAVAVGLGGPLIGDALKTGDTAALAERARRALAMATEA